MVAIFKTYLKLAKVDPNQLHLVCSILTEQTAGYFSEDMSA